MVDCMDMLKKKRECKFLDYESYKSYRIWWVLGVKIRNKCVCVKIFGGLGI